MPSLDIKAPKISAPDIDINLKGPKIKTPKADVNIEGGDIDVEGPEGGFKMPKVKMPKFGFKDPKIEGPEIDVRPLKAGVDISGDIVGPKVNFEGPDVSVPDVDVSLKGPKVKGDISGPRVEGGIKGPDVNVEGPDVDIEGGLKMPKIKMPKFGIKGPRLEGPEGDFNLSGPKIQGDIKGPKVDVSGPSVDIKSGDLELETPEIKGKKSKFKLPRFGFGSPKLEGPDLDVKLKGPKLSGDFDGSADVSLSGPPLQGGIQGPSLDLGAPDVNVKGPKISGGAGGGLHVKGGAGVGVDAPGLEASGGGLDFGDAKVTFPKLKVPKFGIALPQLEGPEMGVDVGTGGVAGAGASLQGPSIGGHLGSPSLEVTGPEVKAGGGGAGGKAKIKMPKFFGKSKVKGGSAADLSLQGPELEVSSGAAGVKASKGLSLSSGELLSGDLSAGGGAGIRVSPAGKSASLDLLKKPRHRSSSLSDDTGVPSPSSPTGHLEAEGGGDLSFEAGGAKVKGKKGKLKFGTFGGFGSKSKGSYEVTLGEEGEARVEGAGGVSLPAKKSRISSSSSSDSGTRGGFRFPRVELAVSKK
ncbi:AHNK protein, partial [Atractosteus spatula]|nr:AHNK protein [Atractosteus spatula]